MNKNLLSMTPKSPMQKAARMIELRKKVDQLKAEIEPLQQEIDLYKGDLLKITQDLDVLTLKTGDYTISRAIRVTPQIIDFKELKEDLIDKDIPFETEEVFTPQTMEMFKEAIKQGKKLNGLEEKETQYISVRIAKDKEVKNENK